MRAVVPEYNDWHTGQRGPFTFYRWALISVETDPINASLYTDPNPNEDAVMQYLGDSPVEFRVSVMNNLSNIQIYLVAKKLGSPITHYALVPAFLYESPSDAEGNPEIVKIILMEG